VGAPALQGKVDQDGVGILVNVGTCRRHGATHLPCTQARNLPPTAEPIGQRQCFSPTGIQATQTEARAISACEQTLVATHTARRPRVDHFSQR
jgi:hypothetical protein